MTEPDGGPAGRPPDLLFCRGCGQSIARRDLLALRALLLEGSAWCPSCAPGTVRFRRASRGLLAAAAVLALAALGWSVWDLGERQAHLREGIRRASELAMEARKEAAASAKRLDALEAEARGLAALVEAEGRSLAELGSSGAAAAEAEEDRLEGVERSLGTLLEAVEGIRKDLAVLKGPEGLSPEEEKDLEERLADVNAGVRFDALWRLRRGTGEAARRAAAKGLADPEDSVRWQAALLVRDLRVKEAVPALVERLADGSVAVRAAAFEALRTIEGVDLGFDPLEPSPDKRGEAIRRWKERIASR